MGQGSRYRQSDRYSRIREESIRRIGENDRRRNPENYVQEETFTTTFTFSNGTTRTEIYNSREQQQRGQEIFDQGREQGIW